MPSPHDARCVAHVDAEMEFSGGERQVFLLIEGLRRRGWRNVLFCQPGSRAAAEADARGIDTRCVPMRHDVDVRAVVRLARELRRLAPDIVHLHTGRATWLGGLGAWLAGRPAITTRRMERPISRGWRTRLIYTRLTQRAVAISPAVARCLAEAGVPAARTRVIASAVAVDALAPRVPAAQTRAAHAAGPEDLVLLVLAALVPRKGGDVLIRALAGVAAGGRRPVLWIAGAGAERARLEDLAREQGVAAQVRFLGQRTDAADLLAACDVLVLPSRREGLGVAALEAMAAGRPVVASAVGGLAEAVVDEQTGLLVPPDDVDALAAALLRLLRDPALRQTLGARGPAHVRAHFSAEHMVAAYAELYESVLSEWPRPQSTARA